MSNGEKLQKTMNEASREYEKLPGYLKQEASRPRSASIDRTVRPTSDREKR
jgi:hypothetical protein